jgi:hypothetical protein
MRINLGLWLCAALMVAAMPAVAQPAPDFDQPVKTVTVSTSYMSSVTCIYYRDVMIQTLSADLAAPGAGAFILPDHKANALIPCQVVTQLQAGIISVSSQGSEIVFIGRKGRFLILGFSGPAGIQIFDVTSGRSLFEDGLYGSVGAVTLKNGVLRMRYSRAVGAQCSLVTDNAGCWAKIVASGALPHGVFVWPPPSEICRKSYSRAFDQIYGAARSDNYNYDYPSVVSYAVDLTLDDAGHAVRRPAGPLQCNLPQ